MQSTQQEMSERNAARIFSSHVINKFPPCGSASQSRREKPPSGIFRCGGILLLSTKRALPDALAFPVKSACAFVPSTNASSSSMERPFVHENTSRIDGLRLVL